MPEKATLNIASISVAYGDVPPTANPKRKYWDWTRYFQQIEISNPKSEEVSLAPGEFQTVFSGTRTLSYDGTTQLTLAAAADASKYRLSWATGTKPGFRTDVGLDLTGVAVTFAVQTNQTVVVSILAELTNFAAVTPTDIVYIPGVTTGDPAGPFNVANTGYWVVLSRPDSHTLVLAAPAGGSFDAANETVTVVAATDFQAYTPTGVQVGDAISFESNLPASMLTTFEISAVTANWIEFVSTNPLALGTYTPGVGSMIVYSMAKKYLRVESDQEIAITTNSDVLDTKSQRIVPIEAGNEEKVGWAERFGPVWTLIVYNRSQQVANVTVISAE